MGMVPGLSMTLYRNTGSHASPTWVLTANVGDAKLNFEKETQDASIRGGLGFGFDVGKLGKFSYEFPAIYDQGDAGFAAMWADCMANTDREYAFADGLIVPASGGTTNYVRALCGVNKAPIDEPLTGASKVTFTIQPTYSVNPVTLVTVTTP
jgi:hypothetical protein